MGSFKELSLVYGISGSNLTIFMALLSVLFSCNRSDDSLSLFSEIISSNETASFSRLDSVFHTRTVSR